SFDQCDHHRCPAIAGGTLPRRMSIVEPEFVQILKSAQTVLSTFPTHIKLAHDESWNLSCPSCRPTLLMNGKTRQAQLERALYDFILPFMRDCRILEMSGDGDPFASHHYRDIMKMTGRDYPALKIQLHTNAVLCDERSWDD